MSLPLPLSLSLPLSLPFILFIRYAYIILLSNIKFIYCYECFAKLYSESQVFRYCQSALDPISLSAAVLTSRQQQPIVNVSAASLVPAAVFAAAAGHHLPRKPTPWYPWAVASGVMGSGHSHHQTSSAHQIIFRDSKDSGKRPIAYINVNNLCISSLCSNRMQSTH